MRFRKKPIIIEAVQLRWDTWSEMCEHASVGHTKDGKPEGCYIDKNGNVSEDAINGRIGMTIPTLEGLMIARQGDWIVKGVKGELYPVKNDIFLETYEAV